RYRLLTVNANDIIFMLDRQNRISFINPAAKPILGYEPGELVGEPVDVLFTDDARRQVAEEGGWVTTEPGQFTTVIDLLARDGRVVPVEVNCSVMRAGGRALGIQGIARDMTERLRMESEL